MNKGPKDFYEWGICFLRAHPKLAGWHERMKKAVIQFTKEETFNQRCTGYKNTPDDAIKQMIVQNFFIAFVLSFFGCIAFLSGDVLTFLITVAGAFLMYVTGTINTEALKRRSGIWEEKTISVMPVTVKPEQVKPVPRKEPEKEVKKKITPFWRLFGLFEMGSTLLWVYLSLARPEALKQWLNQNGMMNYIPHEFGSINQLNETALLIGGIVVLPIGFSLLRGILKIIFWISQKLFPKREIREI